MFPILYVMLERTDNRLLCMQPSSQYINIESHLLRLGATWIVLTWSRFSEAGVILCDYSGVLRSLFVILYKMILIKSWLNLRVRLYDEQLLTKDLRLGKITILRNSLFANPTTIYVAVSSRIPVRSSYRCFLVNNFRRGPIFQTSNFKPCQNFLVGCFWSEWDSISHITQ